jgi:hypothetical protein
MIEPILDRCINCGLPARKPGAGICVRCEIEALISLSYERMKEYMKSDPLRARRITNGIRRLQMTAIQRIKE